MTSLKQQRSLDEGGDAVEEVVAAAEAAGVLQEEEDRIWDLIEVAAAVESLEVAYRREAAVDEEAADFPGYDFTYYIIKV